MDTINAEFSSPSTADIVLKDMSPGGHIYYADSSVLKKDDYMAVRLNNIAGTSIHGRYTFYSDKYEMQGDLRLILLSIYGRPIGKPYTEKMLRLITIAGERLSKYMINNLAEDIFYTEGPNTYMSLFAKLYHQSPQEDQDNPYYLITEAILKLHDPSIVSGEEEDDGQVLSPTEDMLVLDLVARILMTYKLHPKLQKALDSILPRLYYYYLQQAANGKINISEVGSVLSHFLTPDMYKKCNDSILHISSTRNRVTWAYTPVKNILTIPATDFPIFDQGAILKLSVSKIKLNNGTTKSGDILCVYEDDRLIRNRQPHYGARIYVFHPLASLYYPAEESFNLTIITKDDPEFYDSPEYLYPVVTTDKYPQMMSTYNAYQFLFLEDLGNPVNKDIGQMTSRERSMLNVPLDDIELVGWRYVESTAHPGIQYRLPTTKETGAVSIKSTKTTKKQPVIRSLTIEEIDELVSVASTLTGLDFVIIPAIGDTPSVTDWRTYTPQQENVNTIKAMLEESGADNILLVTGGVSGVIVYEVPENELEWWDSLGIGETLEVSTDKGRHFYFAYTEAPLKKLSEHNIKIHTDNDYVVAPGGYHNTTYIIENGYDHPNVTTLAVPPQLL